MELEACQLTTKHGWLVRDIEKLSTRGQNDESALKETLKAKQNLKKDVQHCKAELKISSDTIQQIEAQLQRHTSGSDKSREQYRHDLEQKKQIIEVFKKLIVLFDLLCVRCSKGC